MEKCRLLVVSTLWEKKSECVLKFTETFGFCTLDFEGQQTTLGRIRAEVNSSVVNPARHCLPSGPGQSLTGESTLYDFSKSLFLTVYCSERSIGSVRNGKEIE